MAYPVNPEYLQSVIEESGTQEGVEKASCRWLSSVLLQQLKSLFDLFGAVLAATIVTDQTGCSDTCK
jgi:hypothetical protein